jgi:hypothetical protein
MDKEMILGVKREGAVPNDLLQQPQDSRPPPHSTSDRRSSVSREFAYADRDKMLPIDLISTLHGKPVADGRATFAERVTGGLMNDVKRVRYRLVSDEESPGARSAIIKHAPPAAVSNPDIALDQSRVAFEFMWRPSRARMEALLAAATWRNGCIGQAAVMLSTVHSLLLTRSAQPWARPWLECTC